GGRAGAPAAARAAVLRGDRGPRGPGDPHSGVAGPVHDRSIRPPLPPRRHRRARVPPGARPGNHRLRAGMPEPGGRMSHLIAGLGGDGIGPEVTELAARVLLETAALHGLQIELREGLIGGRAIDQTGSPLPDETLALCRSADAVLLGAVGGPQWPPEA